MSSVALARIYQQSFESRPYYTLAVTNGTLNALGDVVAQSVQLLVCPTFPRCLLVNLTSHCSRRIRKETNTTIPHMIPQEQYGSSYLGLEWVRLHILLPHP
jgi:hypothetical protein